MSAPAPHAINTAPVLVHTSVGAVRGRTVDEGMVAFRGIPFAEPPVGASAWRPAVRRTEWSGIRDATHDGPTPQRRPFMEVTTVPEPSIPGADTLLVNVLTPSIDRSARLPVLVWIHGGGYTAGSPSSPWYQGRAFCAAGIVVVSISYRLGAVGFAQVPGAAPNRAVTDWLAALRWVQDEIRAFGGDPDRVTIAGQSAGGGAVTTLLTLPAAQPLFHRAIAQSPAIGVLHVETAERTAAELAAVLGIPCTAEAFAAVPEAQLLDAQEALIAQRSTLPHRIDSAFSTSRDLTTDFGPVEDGDLIAQGTFEAAREGVGSDKALLIGATADEFTMGARGTADSLGQPDPFAFLTAHGVDEAAARHYVATNDMATAEDAFGRMLTDTTFRRRVDEFAAIPRRAGTWLYDFRFPNPYLGIAVHCGELPFMWNILNDPDARRFAGDTAPQALADQMHGAWTRFIRDGDPGWPAVSAGQPRGMVFDTESYLDADPYHGSRLSA